MAVSIQAIPKTAIAANIVKCASKISEEIDIRKNLFLLPVDFLEFFALVACHFQL